ncbi:LysR family transcriptional regulator [Dongshaea marina]|uniref:LysR family transcriptional regulator n=1 Tax=Dongshaea marina TaxID=2047966 RepID=UPI000D3EAC80|nr:LysR family transcriptional regulator [Dongshaea marina]
MDKLIAMRSFAEVAQTSSFTRAAENLGLSRLQVSRHVQELESWLQQRLLHRTTRRVSLTSSGEEALHHCERILNEAAELQIAAHRKTETLSGTIRLASPLAFAQSMLFELIDEFIKLHPEVSFDLRLSDDFIQLIEDRVDIALRFTPNPEQPWIARHLLTQNKQICASRDYLARHGTPQYPEQLSQHNCLIHMNRDRWQLSKQGNQHEVQVSGNIRANDFGVLVQAALKGRGIIRLEDDLALPLIESGQLLPLLTDYQQPENALWAVYLSRSYQLPAVRRLIDFMVEKWGPDRCNSPLR